MREIYATSRSEGLGAGIFPKPGEVLLYLAVRDDEEQPEQFTLNPSTGRHDCKEKGL